MILQWLAADIEDLFDRHPEARVALWFDAKEEFARLVPRVDEALAKADFPFLAYDPAREHGQLWIKWSIEAGPLADADRVLVWLPFAREQVHSTVGDVRLESLLEYEYSGKIWLIDGKRPTLFAFLRKHGVPLPESRSEQDALWRGGRDSLLAKYAEKYASRDASFWRNTRVTPSAVEASLIGDVVEQVFLVLADPEGAAGDLELRGLLEEFSSQVQSEFGWKASLLPHPAAWARDFASPAALCEIFEACGRPADFPFATRLPESTRRERWLRLIRRWMASRDHEPSFRHWMAEAEKAHDLRGWAGRLNGRPQAFLGLARERWSRFYDSLTDVVGSRTELRTFLDQTQAQVNEEARGFWAGAAGEVPGWALVAQLRALVEQCRDAVDRLDEVASAADMVEAYASRWHTIDHAYWVLLWGIREAGETEGLLPGADAAYREYLEETSRRFYELSRDTASWPPPGCRGVRDVAGQLFSAANPRAVVVIDALRYDLARSIAGDTAGADVQGFVANLPTETFVGMSSLLAVGDVEATLNAQGKMRLVSTQAGGDLVQRQVRWNYLKTRFDARTVGDGDKPADLAGLLDAPNPPAPLPKLLVIMDEEIDGMSHATGSEALHHFDTLLRKLRKGIAKLQRWGYPEVDIVTDHGFVLVGSSITPPTMNVDEASAVVVDARYAFLEDGAVVDGAILPFPMDPRYRLLVAPGLRSFKPPGRFFHGGLTLQEVVIPHIVVRHEVERPRMRVRALVSETEVRTLTFKIELLPEDPRKKGAHGQMTLFAGAPLPVRVRVFLGPSDEPRSSVKEVEVSPEARDPIKVLVHLKPPLDEGEEIEVHVVEAETELEFAENLKVRVMREFE